MKIKITLTILLFSSISAFAQITKEDLDKEIKPLNEKLKILQLENNKLKIQLETTNIKLKTVNKNIDSLRNETKTNGDAITQTANELGLKIKETGDQNAGNISKISKSLSKNSLFGIIGVLLAILLSCVLYWFLSKKQKIDKIEVEEKFADNKASLKIDVVSEIEKSKKEQQEVNVKLEQKLIEILENQIKRIESTDINIGEIDVKPIDHTMPLKVADEITRINAYANSLDPNSQDSKALKSSVKRLVSTFRAEQYEIVDLLGQKYDDGMKVTVVGYVPNAKLSKGEEIISRIIKPQVKFKGEQIQAAQVDVSIGE
ncbi:septum formation initiator [Pedobacter changchengzhani]|uniref:Septum formation initiator n=1 Tax=Pedobacter changchengzhani TaxID=2529274 RepID=A0A4R5MNY8_9SPHI|nr:hypothetical protein [Pedobacter changchengzhani]TDG37550.1 septum formation initiator [Pedobacter changchengzhani]